MRSAMWLSSRDAVTSTPRLLASNSAIWHVGPQCRKLCDCDSWATVMPRTSV